MNVHVPGQGVDVSQFIITTQDYLIWPVGLRMVHLYHCWACRICCDWGVLNIQIHGSTVINYRAERQTSLCNPTFVSFSYSA
jgi:hypothetical protein